MPSLFQISAVSLLLQLVLVVHCVRTGRSFYWIWILLMVPTVGGLAYLIVEVLPELGRSRATRRAVRGMRTALDPGRDLRRLQDQARISGGVDARQKLAEELLRQGKPTEAADIFRQTLTGLYEHDPNLLLGLARAQFAAGQPGDARATLDRLIAHNPGFKSAEGHMLYARSLEAEGNDAKALEEFRTLAGYYAGAEARVRYAQLLRRLGRVTDARQVLTELLELASVAPRHYRRAQAEWLSLAARELGTLPVS